MTDRSAVFSIGTFEADGPAYAGFVVDGTVYPVAAVLPDIRTTADLLVAWDDALDRIAEVVSDADRLAALPAALMAAVHVLPPMQPIGSILAAGANYREHIVQLSVAHRLGRSDASEAQLAEEAGKEADERSATGDPYVWVGLPSAVSGAFDDVRLPAVGENSDWEVELGVVIGRAGYRIAVEDAASYVAGYTICNDLTVRSLVPRTDVAMVGTDWFRSKNHPTFFPTGPVVVPARFVPDPTQLRIQLRLNGDLMQDQTPDDLLFDIPALISYISAFAEIRPGDLLITGSPSGNGSHWKRFLQDGDVMEASITGLGTQRTPVRGPEGGEAPWYGGRRAPASAQ